uniref:Uncharacterized protein n=1 Tax=Aegilops tauschii subsp. strangulata TaxID=200361 RepID=A0A453GBL6_AEGTS
QTTTPVEQTTPPVEQATTSVEQTTPPVEEAPDICEVSQSVRDTLISVSERLLNNRCLQNQCRPPGSEALPRGIVQDKSNFEFESLGGNPGRKGAAAGRPAKSLLAIPVGIKQKAVVDKLVSKVLPGGELRGDAVPLRRRGGRVGRPAVVAPRGARGGRGPDQVVVRQAVPAPGPRRRLRLHLPLGRGHRGGRLRPHEVPQDRQEGGARDLAAGAGPPVADPPPAHGPRAPRRDGAPAVLQDGRRREVLRQQHGAAVHGVGGDDGAGVLARGVAVRVADDPERPRLRLGARLQARVLRAGRPELERRHRRQRVRAPPRHPHAGRRRRQGAGAEGEGVVGDVGGQVRGAAAIV